MPRNPLAERPLDPMQWNGAMDENKTSQHAWRPLWEQQKTSQRADTMTNHMPHMRLISGLKNGLK